MPFFPDAHRFSAHSCEFVEVHGDRYETHTTNYYCSASCSGSACVAQSSKNEPERQTIPTSVSSARTSTISRQSRYHPYRNERSSGAMSPNSVTGASSMSNTNESLYSETSQLGPLHDDRYSSRGTSLLDMIPILDQNTRLKNASVALQHETICLRTSLIILDEAISTVNSAPLAAAIIRKGEAAGERIRQAISQRYWETVSEEASPPRYMGRLRLIISRLLSLHAASGATRIAEVVRSSRMLLESLLAAIAFFWKDQRLRISAPEACDAMDHFLRRLYASVPHVEHIQLHKLNLTDHLGRNIAVPMEFCSSWELFRKVVNSYCIMSAGGDLIKRGDYHILEARFNRTISPARFVELVAPDMTLEMSIIRRPRKRAMLTTICPHCQCSSVIRCKGGWMGCCHCGTRFIYHEPPTPSVVVEDAASQAESLPSFQFRRITVEYQIDQRESDVKWAPLRGKFVSVTKPGNPPAQKEAFSSSLSHILPHPVPPPPVDQDTGLPDSPKHFPDDLFSMVASLPSLPFLDTPSPHPFHEYRDFNLSLAGNHKPSDGTGPASTSLDSTRSGSNGKRWEVFMFPPKSFFTPDIDASFPESSDNDLLALPRASSKKRPSPYPLPSNEFYELPFPSQHSPSASGRSSNPRFLSPHDARGWTPEEFDFSTLQSEALSICDSSPFASALFGDPGSSRMPWVPVDIPAIKSEYTDSADLSFPPLPSRFRPQVASAAMREASLRRRTRTPRFTCNICSSSFTAKHNFERHVRAHSGVKPFACSCGKAFTSKSDRKRHQNSSKNKDCRAVEPVE